MAVVETDCQPRRPARWLYGEGIGVQVWECAGDPRVRASLYVSGEAPPLVILNAAIVGTIHEHGAIAWALARIAAGFVGFDWECIG